MGVDDLLGGEDFLELSIVGRPAHPLRLGNVVTDSAVRPELAPQLEGAPQRPVVRGFTLRAIGKPVGHDPASAAAEYMAKFRVDIETFVAREVIEAATFPDRRELPPIADQKYWAFVDPSGGSSDSMTLAIAHCEGETAVLDVVREVRPPFRPDSVVADFVAARPISLQRGDG